MKKMTERVIREKASNKAVNADAFFVRCAHYKCAGYGWRYVKIGFRFSS